MTSDSIPNDNSFTNASIVNLSSTAGNMSCISCDFKDIPQYYYILITVINVFIFAVGIVGNLMVILVVCRMKSMRNVTNYFLFSLSVADLCVLTVCQPVALMEFHSKDRWYIGFVMCKLIPLLENGILDVSILTMIAMTTERFYSIVYPFRNLANCSDRASIKIIVSLWVIAFTCASPFLFITQLQDATFYDGSPVKVCRTVSQFVWHTVFFVINIVASFLIPLIVLAYMYSRIIRQLMSDTLSVLMQSDSSARITLRSRKQVVRTLILIIILFFVSMCPLRVVSLWMIFAHHEDLDTLGLQGYYNIMWFARIMMYSNSAGNPVIYSLTSTKFKVAFRRVIRNLNFKKPHHSQRTSRIMFRPTQRQLNCVKDPKGLKNAMKCYAASSSDLICLKHEGSNEVYVKIRICQKAM